MKKIILLTIVLLFNCSQKNALTESEFNQARAIYNSNCSMCHGEEGKGNGPSASAFNPPPRNFHLPTERWVNGKSLEGIEKTLTEGIQPNMWAYTGDRTHIPLLAKYVLYLGNQEKK
jgi:mono/diheme cytochrome c family protein